MPRSGASTPSSASPPSSGAPDEALNFLVIGTDQAEQPGAAQRGDSILLVHVPPSQDRAYVISIPRDTWVNVPTASTADRPRHAKINAAYAWGGAPLLVRTVEDFTGVRVDHVAVVDFAGFAEIIDGLGGIEVVVDAPFRSFAAGGAVFPPGTHRMNGAVALEYARERYQFADGDFSRIRHQQAIFTAVLQEVTRAASSSNRRVSTPFCEDSQCRADRRGSGRWGHRLASPQDQGRPGDNADQSHRRSWHDR